MAHQSRNGVDGDRRTAVTVPREELVHVQLFVVGVKKIGRAFGTLTNSCAGMFDGKPYNGSHIRMRSLLVAPV